MITVVGLPEPRRNGVYYQCVCDCGGSLKIAATAIRKKAENNGGCQQCAKGRIGKHNYGSSRNPTYSKYQAMKQRCNNPNHVAYKNYGGRGISVCERWNDFSKFLEDMGDCPDSGYSIDRIDSDGNYEPGNCKWSTVVEQARNMRTNVGVTIYGIEFRAIAEAAEHFGVSKNVLYRRIVVNGWSPERAVEEPIHTEKIKMDCR
ncbi:Uncharacterised protein [Klebsiella pneumoniae]|nr:Uncharacterised protein [Klebsiella quasipneumoniae]SSH50588.1 Uncharacterised protein [Klebsiella quasipneumoniae]SSK05485.1 Uncharacterised protein [Klebsiella pneumoniae]VGD34556.1 Uncharacterised protein [Klebsiella pneumoniae]